MPSLVLGPMLRHVGATDATVWVETDEACEVEVLGRTARTFAADGHHYAVVVLEGLDADASYEYEVRLDGQRVWPQPGSSLPPSVIRTIGPGHPVRLAFGSCRTTAPHSPPYTERRASDDLGRGVDALHALAWRLVRRPPEERPATLLMLGDQIYADEPPPVVVEATGRRQLDGFDDYALCYRAAWETEPVRWMLSTVPVAMIFDDHEIHDGWKTSQAWVDRMRRHDWYDRRVGGGLMAYWIYQHLGNLSPAELRESELLRRCHEVPDAGDLLREFARTADRQGDHSRWSYCRDVGRCRVVVIDTRAGRDLTPGARQIVDDGEWEWILERAASEDYDHLVLASSVPFLLAPGLHDLEAWSEAVADGRWGRTPARLVERFRQRANLSHWAAFQASFHRLAVLLDDLSAGRLRRRPESIVMVSGDVHHCYVAQAAFPQGAGERAPVWQAVCSGLRKQLDPGEEVAMRAASSRGGAAVARALARSVRAARPPMGWRLVDGPLYANQVATLDLDGAPTIRVETTVRSPRVGEPRLETAFERPLA